MTAIEENITLKNPITIKNKQTVLLKQFQVNGSYLIGIYKGFKTESTADIIIQYRQKIDNKWTRQRTPKHIHWMVDILIKSHQDEKLSESLLNFLIELYNNVDPIQNHAQIENLTTTDEFLAEYENELESLSSLSGKGEYSIKFLIVLIKLLIIQEKTNYPDGKLFQNNLKNLKNRNIFKLFSGSW